jgi:hypothetical protein
LGIAPNQTLFVNRALALQNWVEFTNNILIQYPVVKEFNIGPLYESDPLPDPMNYDLQVATHAELTYVSTTSLLTGYTVLVTNDETQQDLWTTYSWTGSAWTLASKQSYYTPFYWSKTDWYDSTYDSTVLPTYVVATASDIDSLTLTVGDTIKVLNSGSGEFEVYRVNSDGTTSLVGIQNGTIQLSTLLYTDAPGNEIRIIVNAIRYYIFVDELAEYFNPTISCLNNLVLTGHLRLVSLVSCISSRLWISLQAIAQTINHITKTISMKLSPIEQVSVNTS